MTRIHVLVFCGLSLAATLESAQVIPEPKESKLSGTWFGEIVLTNADGTVSHNTDVLIIERHGGSITGSTGSTVDQQKPFTNGRLDGGSIRFHLDAQGGMEFSLHLDGGRLQGTATGKSIKAEINLQPAPGLLPHQKLMEEIKDADRHVFAAFEACEVARYASYVSRDLEFYHDHTGKTGYERNLQALRDRCEERIVLRRELVDGTLIVNAVPGYGAVEAGTHRFYSRQPDGSEQLDATSQFTFVWSKETGSWKLVRIISYDHR